MIKLRNGSNGDSNPGSFDCEAGILPLIYRAPQRDDNVTHLWSAHTGCNMGVKWSRY